MIRKTLLGLVVLMLLGGGLGMAALPSVRDKAASVPQRLETWWHEQQPHDLLVPAPPVDGAPADSTALAPTPQPKPTVTSAPRLALPPVPDALKLTGFRHEYQGWNNCGPSTLAM